MSISGIGLPLELTGPWRVAFPPNRGAPAEIALPELVSLHKHSEAGVRYFSGTAAYSRTLAVSGGAWFVLVGWWASGVWMGLAWLLSLTVIGLPIALLMFNRTPFIASLYRY